MENKQKVLLRISNLKQYFPTGKAGMYVKANDGITLDIYEGETFGLVGESGCGKSTLGRAILQVYKQTDGRTMYYGRTRDEVAPKYVKDTITHLEHRIKKHKELEKSLFELQAKYDKMSETEQYAAHESLRVAKKAANDALLDVATIIGGFMASPDLGAVKAIYLEEYHISSRLHKAQEQRKAIQLDSDDAAYADRVARERGKSPKDGPVKAAQAKLDACDRKIAGIEDELKEVRKRMEDMRKPLRSDPEFQKYEAYCDDGIDLARLTYNEMRGLRNDLQLIFQDPYSSLNSRMTVGQIIGEGMLAHKYFKKNDDRMKEEVMHVMEECGLASYFLHRYPHQFSGGQRQRIGIARSLALRPKFVVCDEAVSALDVSIQAQIINLLKDLKEQQNLTYLFITHDLSVVKYISDRIGVMYLGSLVELAQAQDIFDQPLHPYTEALLDAIPTVEEDASKEPMVLEGDIPSPVNPPSGCKFHTRCKYCTEICTKVVPEMTEVKPGHFVACHHILSKGRTDAV